MGPLVNVPAKARAGEVVAVKALLAHPMETGYRVGASGESLARDIVKTFTCTYDGAEVFRADLSPAVAANPFVAFTMVATRSGEVAFRWSDEHGRDWTATATIEVA